MRTKYKVSLITILIIISLLLIVYVRYVKFQNDVIDDIAMVKVKSGLSINYLDGGNIKTKDAMSETSFSITNTTDGILYYFIKLNVNAANKDVNYKIVNNEGFLYKKEENILKTTVYTQVKLEPKETHSYSMELYNPSKEDLDIDINIDLEVVNHSLKNTILQNNEIYSAKNKNYGEAALTNEGILEKDNDEGTIYFFRGDINYNYLWFANMMWRIVRINADGSVLIVLNNTLSDASKFYENNEYVQTAFLESSVYERLNDWYQSNLEEYDEYILNGKYCTDDNVKSVYEGSVKYLPNSRIFEEFMPVYSCPGISNTSRIGLLTADDIMLAGATEGDNQNYYLYNEEINDSWWTMSLSKKENGGYYYIGVNKNGGLIKEVDEGSLLKIRPAITLIKKLNTSGSGTIDDPYTVTVM